MFVGWICLFVVLIGLEMATINLVSIWFALGALCAGLASLLTDSMLIQLLVFTVVSILVLVIMRPFVKKFGNCRKVPTNLDRIVGCVGVVTEDIKPHEVGEVRVDGKTWSAISNKKIVKGKKVEVLSIDSVKLQVKEIEEDE